VERRAAVAASMERIAMVEVAAIEVVAIEVAAIEVVAIDDCSAVRNVGVVVVNY